MLLDEVETDHSSCVSEIQVTVKTTKFRKQPILQQLVLKHLIILMVFSQLRLVMKRQ